LSGLPLWVSVPVCGETTTKCFQVIIASAQSGGWLDSDFAISSFMQSWWVNCQRNCPRAFGTNSTHCVLLSIIINQM
jgi:hypothetical protein